MRLDRPLARQVPIHFAFLLLALGSLPGDQARAEDWPQWLGPRRDGQWREEGILGKFPETGLTYRWRTPIGGGFAGPAVARGRVYVTDRQLPPEISQPKDPFARGEIPLCGIIELPTDPGLTDAARGAAVDFVTSGLGDVISADGLARLGIGRPAVHVGQIATGDEFIEHDLKGGQSEGNRASVYDTAKECASTQ